MKDVHFRSLICYGSDLQLKLQKIVFEIVYNPLILIISRFVLILGSWYCASEQWNIEIYRRGQTHVELQFILIADSLTAIDKDPFWDLVWSVYWWNFIGDIRIARCPRRRHCLSFLKWFKRILIGEQKGKIDSCFWNWVNKQQIS